MPINVSPVEFYRREVDRLLSMADSYQFADVREQLRNVASVFTRLARGRADASDGGTLGGAGGAMVIPILHGPYALSSHGIDVALRSRTPGAYALGAAGAGLIVASYVGRSDRDLAEELRRHVGDGRYSHFAFAPALLPSEAFALECEMYHSWKPRHNGAHPVRAQATDWQCPVCGV